MADWRFCLSESRGFERRSKRDEDFEEEDVWGFVKERDSSSCMSQKLDDYYSSSSSSSSSSWRQRKTAPRMIQKANHTAPSLEPERVKQSSAPLDIPDWSKIYGKNSKMGFWVDDGDIDHHDREGDENEEEDDDDDDGMVPPHEWIAKKLARTQISSFSVCEGVGRTLKGRDLSKLRNAILTKTGFLE